MTTPTLPSFHQKIFAHAKSAKVATDIHLTKNNPFRLFSGSVRAWRPLRERSAFTLVELLGVITIIGILAGLTLGAAGAVRQHGAKSQAKAEVAALQGACERYFADFGIYPSNTTIDPSSSYKPSDYTQVGKQLFTNLFGTNQYNLAPSGKRYFEPKPSMVSSTNTRNPYLVDPWGYAYGYYSDGTNAPLIWSTAGQTNQAGTNKWITSWPKM